MKTTLEQTEAHTSLLIGETQRREVRAGGRRRIPFIAGLIIVCSFYATAIFADFLAPYDYRAQSRREPLAPPAAIHFADAQGAWHLRPFIYPKRLVNALERSYTEDTERSYPLALFTHGYSYKFLGLVNTDIHLWGTGVRGQANTPLAHLLGTDALGRDRLSRLLVATRFSLLVAPLGVLLASLLGIFLGCIAGYARRTLDAVLMRAADVMMALPTLILILAARAAFPLELPPVRAAVLLVMIFVAVGWAEMARLTRGLVMALRRREFVLAAESIGLSQQRVLFRHILPNAAPPLIVQMSLMLPAFLLSETALSFLGVGLQEPEASLGNMLAAATDITLLRSHTFVLLAPAFVIFTFVLGVRLLSGGLKSRSERRD
ncbi:MAG: ABC transporter permease [Pyrinomonadaceae bacterium]